MFDSSLVPVLEKLAIFGERRQEVLAGNIANIDTPGYRRRDLPVERFQEAVRHAIAARGSAGQPAMEAGSPGMGLLPASPGFDGPDAIERLFPRELFRPIRPEPQNLTFQDGNDRSIEHEVMQMTGNALLQNFAVELLAAQMRMIESVVSERV